MPTYHTLLYMDTKQVIMYNVWENKINNRTCLGYVSIHENNNTHQHVSYLGNNTTCRMLGTQQASKGPFQIWQD